MSLLLNNPSVLKKAQDEMDYYVGKDRYVKESDMANLPYLACIIKETLRMYPAGPLLPHESSKDCMVSGYHVPRGTMLLVNAWGIQNDPNNWENPEEFRPERFEGVEGYGEDGFKLLPFGFGRRSCPGENMALRMVGMALGSLVQCFQWERISESKVDMDEGNGISMPKAIHLVGLPGGSGDAYVRHMLMRVRKKGWRVVVFNSRGCGYSPVTTPHEADKCPLSGGVSLCNPFYLVLADEDFQTGFNKVYDKSLASSLQKIFKS
ncbi:hypothetical protein LXL04_031735 [Taraxacum kok-saghyz]